MRKRQDGKLVQNKGHCLYHNRCVAGARDEPQCGKKGKCQLIKVRDEQKPKNRCVYPGATKEYPYGMDDEWVGWVYKGKKNIMTGKTTIDPDYDDIKKKFGPKSKKPDPKWRIKLLLPEAAKTNDPDLGGCADLGGNYCDDIYDKYLKENQIIGYANPA